MHATEGRPDGLAVLQRHRPDAVAGYMQVLGALGGALDPKVKQLVLIALQVTQGSDRALSRHVPRAIELGASPDEILDAILLALPVAGLTRTTEAVGSVAEMLGLGERVGSAAV